MNTAGRLACLLMTSLLACGDEARATPGDATLEPSVDASTADAASGASGDAAQLEIDASMANPPSADAGSLARWHPIDKGLEVRTDQGPVRGKMVGSTRAFLGIPYAAPPVGDLRFRPPAPPAARTAVMEAASYGKVCPQVLPVLGYLSNSSEDCLTLNIWSPNPAPAGPLPVMVWIHGGAFQLGDGGGAYDGQKLSEVGNVLVVTLNYRLGALGFLAHPALAKENAKGNAGNYGIRDQQAALTWVRSNISAFGGDAENVTLFGESAGGHSTCIHLASASSALLFDKAIVQSGLCLRVAETAEEAQERGERFATTLDCRDAACLRALPAEKLVQRSAVLSEQVVGGLPFLSDPSIFFFQPTLDAELLPRQLESTFASGAFNHVPMLHGANTDEGPLFQTSLIGGAAITSREQFERIMTSRFEDRAAAISALYAPPNNSTWSETLSEVTGDFLFVCPARRLAAYLHRAGVVNYLYRFAGTIDSLLVPGLSGRSLHTADVPYVFGNDLPIGWIPAPKLSLQKDVMGFWTRFARDSDPNQQGTTRFPRHDPHSGSEVTLDVPVSVGAQGRQRECELWREVAGAL